MAQKKKPPVADEVRASIGQKARRAAEAQAIAKLADENLSVTEQWRVLTPEHLAYIEARVIGGENTTAACRALGLEPGLLNSYVYMNPDYAAKLNELRKHGSWMMVDQLLALPFRTDLSDNDKKLMMRIIMWYAERVNREVFGERLTIDANINAAPVILPIEAIPYDDLVEAPVEDRSDNAQLNGCRPG